jgi:hypothetical protein
MLIKPDSSSILSDTYQTINKTSIDGNKIRIDSVKYHKNNDKKDELIKSSHFGKIIFKDTALLQDFISTKIDVESGEVTNIESSIAGTKCGFPEVPSNYISPYFEKNKEKLFDAPIIKLGDHELINNNLSDNTDYYITIDVFEDNFNLDFCKTAGLLASVLSMSSILSPFRCVVIIDSDMGINVKEFDPIFKDIELKSLAINNFRRFIKAIDIVERKFNYMCQKENRSIRVYCYIYEFGIIMDIIDKTYNGMKMIFKLNNSDHCRILRSLDAAEGISYSSTDTFETLLDTNCLTLLPSLFDSFEELDEFKYGITNKNYITSYV